MVPLKLGCSLLVLTCFVLFVGDAVIIPSHLPNRPRRPPVIRKPEVIDKPRRQRKVFQPSARRCCQIGERVAKKKINCHEAVVSAFRWYKNEKLKYAKKSVRRLRVSKRRNRHKKLTEKILKCTAAYPKHLSSCCTSRTAFKRHMKKCRQKPRPQRKRCRKAVNRLYS